MRSLVINKTWGEILEDILRLARDVGLAQDFFGPLAQKNPKVVLGYLRI
ncbi:MAG: hypothetical protein HY427_01155 [Candidatus Levybacteria bacterium]|nr:hypothetical protein [Candidatus Levybacteria bacterium]